MNIVTYNMRFGGASKDHWQQIVEQFDPDIFLVQESFNPADHHPAGNKWCHNTIWRPVEGLNWGSAVYVNTTPGVADLLYGDRFPDLEQIEGQIGRRVVIRAMGHFHPEQYEVYSR